ncbi:MAG: hypothetical protein ACOC6H_04440 [Thermoproteota archaeon]
MRYSGSEVAKYFGSRETKETFHLPPKAKYQQLLDVFEKKYQKVLEHSDRRRRNDKMLDSFIFLSEGTPIRTKKGEPVNPEDEVFVGQMDFGG